ncbi:hypothetical protein J2Z58_001353 [Halobacillus andaensis]|nr:hypothetical protein [Halobacillus andaensis]
MTGKTPEDDFTEPFYKKIATVKFNKPFGEGSYVRMMFTEAILVLNYR